MAEVDVVVVGGCGHVGLPLAIALADRGLKTVSYDISDRTVASVMSGMMPFHEDGAEDVLKRTLESGSFGASTDPSTVGNADTVIVVIGTPVDEHLNPDPDAVVNALRDISSYLRNGQQIILRSTVFPGVTARVEQLLRDLNLNVDVAFCPERIAEGRAMIELFTLPQLVGARTSSGHKRAAEVFSKLGVKTIQITPEEAELAKLFTNNWRYLKFAAANQFFVMANDAGLDFNRIQSALTEDYPRAADMPGPGFAAGPCLFKDTMQLAAFSNNRYVLGHSAMLVNEGLPLYLVEQMESKIELKNATVGILGMAFKAESDDTRSSLSYKLKRILKFKARNVICTDPFVTSDEDLHSLDHVLLEADVLIIGAPHKQYREIEFSKPVIDVWNLTGNGTLI